MPKKKLSEKDLTNMSRGFDAPPEKNHLEKIRGMAREIQHEVEKEQGKTQQKDPTGLRKMFAQKKQKKMQREQGGREM